MPETNFKKEIRLFDAVMLVAGTMIGSGIFIVSADIARQTGSAGYLLLVWLLTGLITMMGALSYGELAAMMPKAGGQYVFLREAYNPLLAFLYGWTLFMVIQTGTIAAVAVAFARFTGVLFPFFDEKNILLQFGAFKISTTQLLAIGCISLLTFINIKGVRYAKFIQNFFGSTKIIALFALILLGLAIGINVEVVKLNWENFWQAKQVVLNPDGTVQAIQTIGGMALISAIGVAMVGSLFSSDAWNNITFAGDEVVNPQKTIPLSLAIGTGLVTLLYLLTNVVYLLVLPLRGLQNGTTVLERGIQFATNDRVAVAVAEALGGEWALLAITVLIMVSTFGSDNGCILSGARVYYAIAKDGLFFKNMAKLNSQGVPANALIGQAIWASLLCLSGTYGNLLDYVVFAVLLFYILTIAGIFVLRKTQPHTPRPYKAFGYPFVPLLYIILCSAIEIILLIYKPEYTWAGLLIVGLGIPIYFVFKPQSKSN
ncbi:MAG: amino acid permease [Microscillaceae bacterium]|nr:amino acid permease [Microscillaceae bacterium]MDW8460730.1 amino acid permease [Cytophagales bacterium]